MRYTPEKQLLCLKCSMSHWPVFAMRQTSFSRKIRLFKYTENFTTKKWFFFSDKKILIFFIVLLKTDCGYALDPPWQGGSNAYPQSMFLSRNKKNNVYPWKLQFYYTGQARVTSQRQDNYIRHLRDRFQTAAATASVIIGNRGRQIHHRTVSRHLKEFGIRCRRPYHGSVLTRRHRQLRNNFAQNHQRRVNWHGVVFSDESRFNLYNNDGRVHVYRHNGERYTDNCIVVRDRFCGGGVMVWALLTTTFDRVCG